MFTKYTKLVLIAGLGLGLSACAQFYDGMKASTDGPEFNQALLANYQSLAKEEAREEDWIDADFFGQRASLVAAGEPPLPQAIEERDLVEPHYGELVGARNMLMAALEDGGRTTYPQSAADAQAGFDCWMQEAEENIQPDDIQACKDMFNKGMQGMEPKAMPAPTPAPVPGAWTVYFDFDKSNITYDAQLVINEAVSAASKAPGSQVLLTAHTDTAGSEQYNLDLSARRAKSVVDAMDLVGVSSDRITASAVGESDVAVATGDGVPEARNRRVEIRLAQ